MRFARGHEKIGGRKKGTPNKLTTTVKDAIAQVAERLGGVERMVRWVKEDPENERSFWVSIYPKLLSVQHAGDANNLRGDITFTWKPPTDYGTATATKQTNAGSNEIAVHPK